MSDPATVDRIRVLMNPRSGLGRSQAVILQSLEAAWADSGVELTYQVSHDVRDGQEKVRRAIGEGVKVVIVAGGDGMVNTIGAELVGTDVALGVLPVGSGNGFARHFGIPLQPARAALALRRARSCLIDVGYANDRAFFVTCGMAADAELVRHFEKSPVRGVLPYVLAAAYEMIDYDPQPMRVVLDDEAPIDLSNVLVFTVANLTQFGAGAVIAPQACADDGWLEMVVVQNQTAADLVKALPRLFNGTLDQTPGIQIRRFRSMHLNRARPGMIQVDGEALEAGAEITVRVRERALNVLVPPMFSKAAPNSP